MNRNSFFSVRNMTDDRAEIYIYGDIVSSDWEKWSENDVCPLDIKNAIDSVGGRNADIHIYSAGGSVFAGEAIRNMLSRLTGHKRVYIDGLAASIASAIAMCYDELHISEGSYMVIHNPSTQIWGTAEDLRKAADTLDMIKGTIIEVYSQKAADSFDTSLLDSMLNEETWLTAKDVCAMFKNAVLDNSRAYISDSIDNKMLKYFNRLPGDIILPSASVTAENEADEMRLQMECERLKNELRIKNISSKAR